MWCQPNPYKKLPVLTGYQNLHPTKFATSRKYMTSKTVNLWPAICVQTELNTFYKLTCLTTCHSRCPILGRVLSCIPKNAVKQIQKLRTWYQKFPTLDICTWKMFHCLFDIRQHIHIITCLLKIRRHFCSAIIEKYHVDFTSSVPCLSLFRLYNELYRNGFIFWTNVLYSNYIKSNRSAVNLYREYYPVLKSCNCRYLLKTL